MEGVHVGEVRVRLDCVGYSRRVNFGFGWELGAKDGFREGKHVVIFGVLVEETCFPLLSVGAFQVLKNEAFGFRLFWKDEL